jgi:AGCS family alanine or glycine:cation symporter
MYVWSTVKKPWAKYLAWFFALCGVIGTLSLFQINQMSRFLELQYQVPPLMTGLVIAFLVLVILSGGLKRIAIVCTSLVPTMAFFYLAMCSWILISHFDQVPRLFAAIFEHAFTGHSVWGGFSGFAVSEIMKIGLRRATFSNEAGLGTAPMAHSNVRTSEPATQGFLAMLSPFWDTIIACTMTALVILLAYEPHFQGQKGIDLSLLAFGKMIPIWGPHLLSVGIFLFSFTTIVGCANYNSKCWDFVFKGTRLKSNRIFISWYVVTVVAGSVLSLSDVVNLIDIGYGLMAVPNVLALLYFRKEIQQVSDQYIETYLRRR